MGNLEAIAVVYNEEAVNEHERMIEQASTKYYVAKLYKHCTPSIVEIFDTYELANSYAGLMTSAEKGHFVVMTLCQPL